MLIHSPLTAFFNPLPGFSFTILKEVSALIYQHWSYGAMVSTQDSESCDPSSSLGRTSHFIILVNLATIID
jgi:hypothetical protein